MSDRVFLHNLKSLKFDLELRSLCTLLKIFLILFSATTKIKSHKKIAKNMCLLGLFWCGDCYVVLCLTHFETIVSGCYCGVTVVSALLGGHSETEQSTLYGVQLPLHHHVLNTNQLQPTETQYRQSFN